jgi:hypothetical protein
MVGLQNRGRDGMGLSIAELGVGRLVCDLADDAKIIQRVGEVRMERAEVGLLQKGSFA